MKATGDIGIYVHFPFCRDRCHYCDFHTQVLDDLPHEEYRTAVTLELQQRGQPALAGRTLRSVYFGGGTPSLWDPAAVGALLDQVRSVASRRAEPLEVTLEANAETLTTNLVARFADSGVNRLSLGVQSFNDDTLARLGRRHSARDARNALYAAMESAISAITFDLIFAVPDQSLVAWRTELRAAAEFDRVDHISVYELTFHGDTPLGRKLADGRIAPLSDDAVTAMWEETETWMAARQRAHYEVSNYAREGTESVHNTLYWQGGEYLGLGVSAHSMSVTPAQVIRRENCGELSAYLENPTAAPARNDLVTPRTHLAERLFLGLRTREGIDLEVLASQLELSIPETVTSTLDRATELGLLVHDGNRYHPTSLGLLQADTIAVDLF